MGEINISDYCHNLGVSRETYQKLETYRRLLIQWQTKINLVAPSTINEFWHRHVADSLQCIRIKPNIQKWTDIGSGAGFPGLVVAMALADRGNTKVTLIDSNHKKCAFLRTVVRETGLTADVIPTRIETYVSENNAPEVVLARAVSSLDNLLKLCKPWLAGDCIGLFHKGLDYRREMLETHDKWHYNLIEHHSDVLEGSVVLDISNLSHL